ncbi:dUTP diphosphatase [Buchnera aphidicola (Taiwanaphis decaspermi)]|uniref:dUTP diphosphatase n=1 Tax=Buchnera aphidicola TaxID=9 RepID=UPI0031B8B127
MFLDKKIKIIILDKRLGKQFPKPEYTTKGSAGIDIRVCNYKKIELKPNKNILLPTGISIKMYTSNIAGMIIPRSGLAHYHGIVLGNLVGLIDSDYTGEIMLSIWNRGEKDFFINPGDRLAQIVFLNIIRSNLNFSKNIIKKKRNNKGFGHTGYK